MPHWWNGCHNQLISFGKRKESMRSRIVTGALIGLLAALSIAAGPAQGKPAAQEKPEPEQPGSAVAFKTLLNFDYTDGAAPQAPLVQGTDGNLYGTTGRRRALWLGDSLQDHSPGRADHPLQLLRADQLPGRQYTEAALTLGTDGNFYGTTFGGRGRRRLPSGLRCCLQDHPGRRHDHALQLSCRCRVAPDGAAPGALVQGNDGNFYGTTDRRAAATA